MSQFLRALPVLRVTSLEAGYALYFRLLCFHPHWERPATPDAPGEAELWRDQAGIRISEGVASGATAILPLTGLESLRHDVVFRGGEALPPVEALSPGFRRLVFDDPFGNRLIFEEAD